MAAKNIVDRERTIALSADRRRWTAWPAGDSPEAEIPIWVPAPGAIITYESDGEVLINKFRDTVVGDAFYPSKIRNAYSGTFLHPTWKQSIGAYGGMIFVGGGHANTNYNAVHIATLGHTTIQFERVINATTWTGGDPGDISAEYNAHGEKIGSDPRQITQGHSYGMRAVVGGKLIAVIRQAFMSFGSGGTESQSYHSLDLNDHTVASSARAWVRETDDLGAWANTASPGFIAYAEGQNRLYYMTRGNSAVMRWFDLTSKTWVTGTGASWGYPSSDSDGGDPVSGTLFPVPERNLIVAAYRQGGNLVIQYLQATTSDPAVATATLGSSLALPVAGGKAVCWCPDNNRILVYGVTSNNDKCYEVTIPATLSDTWTVDAAPLSGGSLDPVAIMTRAGWGCQYNQAAKCVMFWHDLKNASSSPDAIDRVTVHRPRNT